MDSCECYLALWPPSPMSQWPRKGAISPHGPQYHLKKRSTLWTFVPFGDAESVSKVRTCPLIVPQGHQTSGREVTHPLGTNPYVFCFLSAFHGMNKIYRLLIFHLSPGLLMPHIPECLKSSEWRASLFPNPACTSIFFKCKKKKLQKRKRKEKKSQANTSPNFYYDIQQT